MSGQEHYYYFEPDELHPQFIELLRRCPAQVNHSLSTARVSGKADAPTLPVQEKSPRQYATQPPVAQRSLPVIEASVISAPQVVNHQEFPTQEVAKQRPQLDEHMTSDRQSPSQPSTRSTGPRISVHALGQFAFCARAGVLASESKDESDHDQDPIRLTYLPNFDLALIEEKLFERLRRGALLLAAVAVSFGLLLVALWHTQFWWIQAALVFTIVLVKCCMDVAGEIVVLARRRHLAISAQPLPPLEEISAVTSVNWWSMLKSGFEPVNFHSPLRHPELPLEGNPWRVLQYASLRIPVILSDSAKLGPNSGTLYSKHQIRLAAYALLLSAADHIRVPYGLVFTANSPHGLAVPIDQTLNARAIDFVHRVYGTLYQDSWP